MRMLHHASILDAMFSCKASLNSIQCPARISTRRGLDKLMTAPWGGPGGRSSEWDTVVEQFDKKTVPHGDFKPPKNHGW